MEGGTGMFFKKEKKKPVKKPLLSPPILKMEFSKYLGKCMVPQGRCLFE